MKKVILIISLMLFRLITFSQSIDGDVLFDDTFLHEIRFETADTNLFITTKKYQQLKMVVDGNVVDSIGFKRKGNISGYSNPNKFAIKIKTNKYVKGKEYDGIKEFTLHMNFQDPTMMREKLTYDICADMGLFSLRTAFVKVFINNNYWGVYTLVEGKDEMYKHVFKNRDIDAIESLDFGNMCFISNNPVDYDVDNNGGNPTYQFENGNEETAWSRFSTMIDKANNTTNNQYIDTVSTYLNLEDFIKYQAINVYLMNMDSYIGFLGNQIYVYDTVANLWQVTPWDFNASFGLWNTNNFTPSTYEMIPNSISDGCIANKVNSIPELMTYYLDAMCKLNNTVGDTTSYFNRIDMWKEQIKQAVYEDTRKHTTNADFNNGIEYGFHTLFGENQPALKTFVTQRLRLITQELADRNYDCESNEPTDPLGIEQFDRHNNFMEIFPNPTNKYIKINLGDETQNLIYVSIINAKGEVIQRHSEELLKINIEKLVPGLYFVLTQSGKRKYTAKFIKE